MSYWKSFPASYAKERPAWLFRVCSKLWYTDKPHTDDCRCDGCWLGQVGQLSLKL